jgi:hypothetical protein
MTLGVNISVVDAITHIKECFAPFSTSEHSIPVILLTSGCDNQKASLMISKFLLRQNKKNLVIENH